MISKSYPYLSIARKYDIPYEEVLSIADTVKNMGYADFVPTHNNVEMVYDVMDAAAYFDSVQAGVIPFPTT